MASGRTSASAMPFCQSWDRTTPACPSSGIATSRFSRNHCQLMRSSTCTIAIASGTSRSRPSQLQAESAMPPYLESIWQPSMQTIGLQLANADRDEPGQRKALWNFSWTPGGPASRCISATVPGLLLENASKKAAIFWKASGVSSIKVFVALSRILYAVLREIFTRNLPSSLLRSKVPVIFDPSVNMVAAAGTRTLL